MKGFAEKLTFLTAKNGSTQFEKEFIPGLWSGVYAQIDGTNNSGQTASHADFEFHINVNGRQIMRLNGAFIKELNNQMLGSVLETSVANGTLALAFFIPFSFAGVDNSLHVRPGDTVTVTYVPGSTYATEVASATVTVYLVQGDAPQRYIPTLLSNNQTVSAAATIREPLPFKNIKEVWVNGTYITRLLAHRDGEIKANGTYSHLLAFTSITSAIEGAQATYVHLNFGDAINDFLSENVDLELTFSQADTATIYVLGFDFNEADYQASVATKRNEVSKRVARSADAGKALPILRTSQKAVTAESIAS